MHLINNYVTSKEKTELLQIFKLLDVNGDGTLSKEEIIAGNFTKKNLYFKK